MLLTAPAPARKITALGATLQAGLAYGDISGTASGTSAVFIRPNRATSLPLLLNSHNRVYSEGIGALSGTAAGTSTVSGVLVAAAGVVRNAPFPARRLVALAATFEAAAALGNVSGTAAGTGSASGLLTGRGALSGAAAGSSVVSGALLPTEGRQVAAGGPARRLTALAATLQAGSVFQDISGTAAGTGTAAGLLVGRGALSGAAAGTSTVSGALVAAGLQLPAPAPTRQLRALTAILESAGTVIDISGTATGAGTVSVRPNRATSLPLLLNPQSTIWFEGRAALSSTAAGTSSVSGHVEQVPPVIAALPSPVRQLRALAATLEVATEQTLTATPVAAGWRVGSAQMKATKKPRKLKRHGRPPTDGHRRPSVDGKERPFAERNE